MNTSDPNPAPATAGAVTQIQAALAALQRGDAAAALASAESAVHLAPALPAAHFVHARALRAAGRAADAVPACRAAIAAGADLPDGHLELAAALRQAGFAAQAEGAYRAAAARWPAHAGLRVNLANLLKQRGGLAEAEAEYRAALERAPKLPQAMVELGLLLQARGEVAPARLLFVDALAAQADFRPAWDALIASMEASHPVFGISSLMAPLADDSPLRPLIVMAEAARRFGAENHPVVLYGLAVAAHAQGWMDPAIELLDRLKAVAPSETLQLEALYLQAICQEGSGDVTGALANAQALAARTRNAHQLALTHHLRGVLHKQCGDIESAQAEFRRALALAPTVANVHTACAATLQLHAEGVDAPQCFAQAGRHIECLALESPPRAHANPRDPHRRLKIGYLSGDFRQHSCAYFVLPLLAAHDPAAVEVFAYASSPREDAITQQMRALVPHWRPCSTLGDEALARRIADDGIDILVDLAGLTDGNRLALMALKPAPLQLSWLGFLGWNGLRTMDGRITDARVDTPGIDWPAPIEPPLRLNRSYLCYQPPADAPPVAAPPLLERGYPTFGSFNSVTKLSDSVLQLWARVLQAVPDSQLLIKSRPLRDDGVRELVWGRMRRVGIDTARVRLLPWSGPVQSHLRQYGEIDVALDSFPYNGVTTTCEASWMGVPVVSLVGRTPVSRQGLTLLSALGTPELAAPSADAFVECCRSLVADPAALAQRRAGLRARMAASDLSDADGFARALEALYRQQWQGWCTSAPR